MTVLALIQSFCRRTALPVPSTIEGGEDPQVVQIVELLNQGLEELCRKWSWQSLTREAHFTTVASESQGLLEDIAPDGFVSIFQSTIYNRTLRLPVYGPVQGATWQGLKALPTTGPLYKYRIVRGEILFNPVPIAGHQCYFEYKSRNAVIAGDTSVKAAFTEDSDTCVFPDDILMAYLRFAFKQEKGFEYAEDEARYEEAVRSASGIDATKPAIRMDSLSSDWKPGIFVPFGNWRV